MDGAIGPCYLLAFPGTPLVGFGKLTDRRYDEYDSGTWWGEVMFGALPGTRPYEGTWRRSKRDPEWVWLKGGPAGRKRKRKKKREERARRKAARLAPAPV